MLEGNGNKGPAPGAEVVDPAMAGFIQQDEMLRELIAIRRIAELQIPKGKVASKVFSITSGGIDSISDLDSPWFGVTITNDGPGTVTYQVNNSQQIEIRSGETRNIDMGFPVLHYFIFRAASGVTASGRLDGRY